MYLTDRHRQEDILKKLTQSDTLTLEAIQQKLHTAAGGSAANTAFGVCQLGGSAGLCGIVGEDGFGDLYIQHMRESKVQFNEKRQSGMTGTCLVLISDDAQRTMLTHLGVASEIDYAHVNEQHLKQSRYMYIEGYLFDSERATNTVLEAIETARKNKIQIALTASDAFCIERHKELFLKLLAHDIDILFANAQEAQALTDTETTQEAVSALAGMCGNVAVTEGEHGSLLHFGGSEIRIKPHLISAIDTTGAGDSYAAGLLFGLANNYTLEQSGNIASFFSARVVSQIGPRYTGNISSELMSLERG
jgi:hypothetical protein